VRSADYCRCGSISDVFHSLHQGPNGHPNKRPLQLQDRRGSIHHEPEPDDSRFRSWEPYRRLRDGLSDHAGLVGCWRERRHTSRNRQRTLESATVPRTDRFACSSSCGGLLQFNTPGPYIVITLTILFLHVVSANLLIPKLAPIDGALSVWRLVSRGLCHTRRIHFLFDASEHRSVGSLRFVLIIPARCYESKVVGGQFWARSFRIVLHIEQLCTVSISPRNVAFNHGTIVGLSKTNSVRRSAEGMRH